MSQSPRRDPDGKQGLGQQQAQPRYQGPPRYQGQPPDPRQPPYQGQPPYQDQPRYQNQSPYQDQPYTRQPQYQGQPNGTPPGQQLYPDPGDVNGDRLERPRRRKRRQAPGVIIGAAIAVIGIVVAVAIVWAGNGGHTVATGQSAATRTSGSIAPKPPHLAKLGSTLVLAGDRAGEKVTITLMKVFSHPQPASRVNVLRQDYRLYAVQFLFDNTGRVAYSDHAANGAMVLDSVGHSYASSRDAVTGCRSFVGTQKIAVGSSELRCIVFEVPATAKITQVWFVLAPGTGAQAGLWQIRS
jgi:hypothetical protein